MDGQKTEVGRERAAPIDAGLAPRTDKGDRVATIPGFLPLAMEDPWRIGPTAVAALQRTVGNQAVVDVLQRQRAPAAPALPEPTNDQIVAEIGSTLGGPFASYQAFIASMSAGTFLGHNIRDGVRPEFLVKLADAETRIDDEYTLSGRRRPPNNGISSIGGFRASAGYHGWGLAIDIDVARNPYVAHEAGETRIDAQTSVAYHRAARFILNRPITSPAGTSEQSIIPALIAAEEPQPLNVGGSTGRRDRVGEYFDRLQLESDAMKRYFELMNDQAKLTAFLTNEWPQLHPNETAPAADVVTREMWEDFAALGGAVPQGGPAGVPGFTPPAEGERGADRPFRPRSAGQQDPGQGFLTIPREVVLGLSQAVSRWGAIDFGGASGDVQHFDDGKRLGRAINAAKSAARRRIRERAAAAAAAATVGEGSGASAPTVAPTPIQRHKEQEMKGSVHAQRLAHRGPTGRPRSAVAEEEPLAELQHTAGNRAVVELLEHRGPDGNGASPALAGVALQRRTEPGSGSEEGGVYSDGPDVPASTLTDDERLSGAHWKQIADDNWGGATPDIAELESSFGADLTAFLDMLAANNITYQLTSGFRPPERSYLFHYCVKVAKGKIKPSNVPAMAGVDIVWDHGNLADSKAGAQALADEFGLVGVAAHPSNHNAGTAIDMKLDFSGNTTNKITYTVGGTTKTRTIKTSDEARVGVSSKGKSISGIASRELSKAGADFGVKRAVDSDIVHWSRSGN